MAISDESKEQGKYHLIKIDKIIFPEFRDKSRLNVEFIKELSEDIRDHGLLQPITVVDNGDGTYTKQLGRNRLEACKLLGWEEIKATIVPMGSPIEFQIKVFHENIMREELNAWDYVRNVIHIFTLKLKKDHTEVLKMCNVALNYEKGNVSSEEAAQTHKLITQCNKEVKGYDTLQTLVRETQLFKINPLILSELKIGEISLSMALLLKKVKKDEVLKKILSKVIEDNLSIAKTKELLEKEQGSKPAKKVKISNPLAKAPGVYKKLKAEKRKEFDAELEALLKKYAALQA